MHAAPLGGVAGLLVGGICGAVLNSSKCCSGMLQIEGHHCTQKCILVLLAMHAIVTAPVHVLTPCVAMCESAARLKRCRGQQYCWQPAAHLLPCLATLAPAAAATTDEPVEMLTEPMPSPPVPTMSTTAAGVAPVCVYGHVSRSYWYRHTVPHNAGGAVAASTLCCCMAGASGCRNALQHLEQ